ncbi:hypothetical protein [Bradyrhizobium sp. 27S5]|uniref:hypothetical protein n=1 Tax=Bradyrhizobium sp. 27S5 TaxID=3139728 RepID=UPI0030D2D950
MKSIALALFAVVTSSGAFAGEAEVKRFFQDEFFFAEIVEAAAVVDRKCSGLHLIAENVRAARYEAGATDDVLQSPEYQLWAARGRAAAEEGYAKDPGHCRLSGGQQIALITDCRQDRSRVQYGSYS